MKYKYNIIQLAAFLQILFLFSCQKEFEREREYPVVKISSEIIQNENGVNFKAEITNFGSMEIIEKGFVWSASGLPCLASPKIVVNDEFLEGKFEAYSKVDFKKDIVFQVRAYAKNKNYTSFSLPVEFVCNYNSPLPVITSIYPKMAQWDDTVKINGVNFSYIPEKMGLTFGDVQAEIISTTDTLIVTSVPAEINPDSVLINVIVDSYNAVSLDYFKYEYPEIIDFEPKSGTFLDTITITGKDFSENINYYSVTVGGVLSQVLSIQSTEIKFLVPPDVQTISSKIILSSYGLEKTFNEKFQLNPPSILEFTPDIMDVSNYEIVIKGDNICPIINLNSVFVGGVEAEIVEASLNEIKVLFPFDLLTGEYDIYLNVLGQNTTSSSKLIFQNPWAMIQNFSGEARSRANCISVNNEAYLLSGIIDSPIYTVERIYDLWKYNHIDDTWIELANYPDDHLTDQTVLFSMNNKIFVSPGSGYTIFYSYNLLNNQWTKLNNLPFYAFSAGVGFSINGKGYLFEGDSRILWKYDDHDDLWTKQSHLFTFNGLGLASHFVIDDVFYLCCGTYGPLDSVHNLLWAYDSLTDTWQEKASLPATGRSSAAGFSINGKGYVGLGIDKNQNALNDFWEYNPNTDSWRRVSDFPGIPRNNPAFFAIESKGYVGLGSKNEYDGFLNDIWELNLKK